MNQSESEKFGAIVFDWLEANGAYDAAAELVIHSLVRIKLLEVDQLELPDELVGLANENWAASLKLASHWFTGGNDDKILALLREFESSHSHEEFAACLSLRIEEWSHTFPEALPSAGEWFKEPD